MTDEKTTEQLQKENQDRHDAAFRFIGSIESIVDRYQNGILTPVEAMRRTENALNVCVKAQGWERK